jgi:hypothetical protein
LLLVDGSLEDYQHIHPEPDGDDGQWSFDFTPRRPGNYQFFAEFVPSLTLRETIGTATLAVPGATQPKVARGLAPYTADGYTYTLRAPGGQAVTGTDISLELTVQRADGGAVKLEPVMGALAHLVAFDDALHGYAHLHPGVSGHEDDLRAPQLSFLFNTTKPGRYRIWAQVKLDGQERFAPFDLEVGGA